MANNKPVRRALRIAGLGGMLLVAVALVKRLFSGPATSRGAPAAHDPAGATFVARLFKQIGTNLPSFSARPNIERSDTARASLFSPSAPSQNRTYPGAFLHGSYTNQAGTRTYKLYIPERYHGQALPLVVMLHGCKQDPDDFAAGTRMNQLAEDTPCFVIYPAQGYITNALRCWNWFDAAHQLREQGEPSIIAGITRDVIKHYPVDERRVYVAGLSAGGAMAAVMGATYPDLYAAVGIHSGLPYAVAHDIHSAIELMKQGTVPLGRRTDDGVRAVRRAPLIVPTIVLHGDQDKKVHPSNGGHVISHWTTVHPRDEALARKGANARAIVQKGWLRDGYPYTRTIYHDARERPIMEQWQIHGAGHAWSGGCSSGTFTDPRGPDASKEILRFFLEHPRRRGTTLLRWMSRRYG